MFQLFLESLDNRKKIKPGYRHDEAGSVNSFLDQTVSSIEGDYTLTHWTKNMLIDSSTTVQTKENKTVAFTNNQFSLVSC